MKKCPECAELIQPDASKCRYCGAKQGSESASCFGLFLALIVVMGVVGQCGRGEDKPAESKAPAHMLTAKAIKECNDTIALSIKKGLIKRRPDNNRVDVDDVAWELSDANDKKALIGILGCAAFGRKLRDFESLEQYVVVYGARSGKRLAMGSEFGVSFD